MNPNLVRVSQEASKTHITWVAKGGTIHIDFDITISWWVSTNAPKDSTVHILTIYRKRMIWENTINWSPIIFLNILKNLVISIPVHLPTNNYEKWTCLNHNMMLEPNLTTANREIGWTRGMKLTRDRHSFREIPKSMQVIFHHSPTHITCCISCKMS